MTFDEALSEAVDGARVRATNMQPGVFIDYNFAGWRINFPGGSGSGYTFKDIDKVSEWELWQEPEKPKLPELSPMLAVAKVPAPKPVPTEPKRRGRPAWTPPAEINDIDDSKPEPEIKGWGVSGVWVDELAEPEAKPNPWAALKPKCEHSNIVQVWGKVKCADCGEDLT